MTHISDHPFAAGRQLDYTGTTSGRPMRFTSEGVKITGKLALIVPTEAIESGAPIRYEVPVSDASWMLRHGVLLPVVPADLADEAAPAWYIAYCVNCDMKQPFRVRSDRDTWADQHREGADHEVQLSEEGVLGPPLYDEPVGGMAADPLRL